MYGVIKNNLNAIYGDPLKCTACKGKLNGKYYGLSLSRNPVHFGNDKCPDISLMYPSLMVYHHRLCSHCYGKIVATLEDVENG